MPTTHLKHDSLPSCCSGSYVFSSLRTLLRDYYAKNYLWTPLTMLAQVSTRFSTQFVILRFRKPSYRRQSTSDFT